MAPGRTMSTRRCRIRHRRSADTDAPAANPRLLESRPGMDALPAGLGRDPGSARRRRSAVAVVLTAAASLTLGLGTAGCRSDGEGETANPSALAAMPSTEPEIAPGSSNSPSLPTPTSSTPTGELSREEWTYAGRTGQRILTPNYEIHTTIRYDKVVERLPLFMEAALQHYRSAVMELPPPPKPMQSFVFHDRAEWETKTVEVIPQQASQLRGLGRGGFSTRGIAVLYYLDWSGRSRDTLAIAGHEGWHQYTQTTFRNQLPLWLEEGMATYMEGHRWGSPDSAPEFDPQRNWERWSTLRSVIRRDRLIPLRELVSKSPQEFLAEGKGDLLTYYAQVWALTRFIVEFEDAKYRPALESILGAAVDGTLNRTVARSPRVAAAGGRSRAILRSRVGPWLLLAYVTEDLGVFEREYEQYCRELVTRRRR